MAGLITRIGQWIDTKWEEKATVREVYVIRHALEVDVEQQAEDLRGEIEALRTVCNEGLKQMVTNIDVMRVSIANDMKLLNRPSEETKEVADLKTRIERIELYSGMTRKVDPTKPPVAKSAFSM